MEDQAAGGQSSGVRAVGAIVGATLAAPLGGLAVPLGSWLGAETAALLASLSGGVAANLASGKVLDTWRSFAGDKNAHIQRAAYQAIQAALEDVRQEKYAAWFDLWRGRLARVDPDSEDDLYRLWGDYQADRPITMLTGAEWMESMEPALVRWANDEAIQLRAKQTRADGRLLDTAPTGFEALDPELRKLLRKDLWERLDRRLAEQLKGRREEQADAFKAVLIEAVKEILRKLEEQGKDIREIKAMVAELTAQLASRQAREAGAGEELDHLRAEVKRLRQEVRDEARAHGRTQGAKEALRERLDEAAAALNEKIDELAAKDQEIAEYRKQMQGLAEDPAKRDALARYLDGDRKGAFPVLEAIARAENAARLRELATLALNMLDLGEKPLTEVIALWQDAQREAPDYHRGWVELRRLLQEAGRLAEARAAADRALETAADERERSVAFNELGDVESEAGDLTAARQSFTQGLEIRRRLAEANPDSAQAQRDLTVSYNKLGDVESEAGDLTAARQTFTQGLEISRRLAEANPDSAQAQRDLSISYERLGDVESEAGDLTAARQSYSAGLEISRRLAEANPDSAQAQRDLTVSYNKLGDVGAARQSFTQGLEIRRRLAEANPDSAQAQRDLSIGYNKLGDVEREAGDLTAARQSFTRGLEISRRLAEANPDSAQAQRDLSISYDRLGDVEREAGDLTAARQSFTQGLEIRRRLAEANPDSAQAQRDLIVSCAKLGQTTGEQSWWREGLEIAEKLHAEGRLAPRDHRMLPVLREMAG